MAPRLQIMAGWLLCSLLLATSLPVLVQAWQEFYWKPQRMRQLATQAPTALTVQFEKAAIAANTTWAPGDKEFKWNGAWYDVLTVTKDSVLAVPDHLEQQLEQWLEDNAEDYDPQQPAHAWALSMPVQFTFISPFFCKEYSPFSVFEPTQHCRDFFKPPAAKA